MVFNTGAALLDAIVLAVVYREEEGTYGYKITQDVRAVIEISESTLYPVLRRLQKYQDGRFLQIFFIIFSHFSTPLPCKYGFFHLNFCNLR